MRFDNLEVAIHLNSDEPPSLTLAFYIIQSLVRDIEAASGNKFKNVDIGDPDEFPNLLANQCRTIRTVYENNAEQLSGNQKRLSELNDKLSGIQSELEKLSKLTSELRTVKKALGEKQQEYDDLEAEYSSLMQQQKDYLALCEECENLIADIEKLKNYDLVSKNKEKVRLEEEYNASDSKKRELNDQLNQLESEKKAIMEENSGLEELCRHQKDEIEQAQEELAALKLSVADSESVIAGLQNDIEEYKANSEELSKKQEESQIYLDELTKSVQEKSNTFRSFYESEIRPLEDENSRLHTLVDLKQTERERLREEIDEMQQRYSELLTEVASLMSEKPMTEKQLADKEAQRQSLLETKNGLDKKQKLSAAKLDEIQNEITKIHNSINHFENVLIPQSQTILEEAQRDFENEASILESMKKDIEKINSECERVERSISESSAVLQEKKEKLDLLISKHNNSNSEISRLEQQLDELKGKTDRDTVSTLREQLKREISEYEKLSAEMTSLTEECREAREKNEEERQTVTKLRNNKDEYDREKKKLDNLIYELSFLSSDEFKSKFRTVSERYQLINMIKSRMEASLKKISSLLSYNQSSVSTLFSDEVEESLREISQYFNELQESMVKYTDNLFKKEGNT